LPFLQKHTLPGVSTVHAGVAVSLNSRHQGRLHSELHSTAIRHRQCWTWSCSVTLVTVYTHGPSPRTGPPAHACLGCLACTRSGHQQTLDAVMLCAHEFPPPPSPHRVVEAPFVGIYQARHNWGRYTVAGSVSGNLFPTKDAGAGVRRSKSKASLDVQMQRAAVTNGALVSGCQAWVRDDPGALSQRLHPDTWFRARLPRPLLERGGGHWHAADVSRARPLGLLSPCASTCECRAETAGFWARRQPQFLAPLRGQARSGLLPAPRLGD
jgi:hypothetical protein